MYELPGFFFCGILVLFLVERQFGAVAVLDFDTRVIIPGNGVVVVPFTIAWNIVDTLYELSGFFF